MILEIRNFQLLKLTGFWMQFIQFQVAEALKDPFGDDVDDFRIGPLLSRHLWVLHLFILRLKLYLI